MAGDYDSCFSFFRIFDDFLFNLISDYGIQTVEGLIKEKILRMTGKGKDVMRMNI